MAARRLSTAGDKATIVARLHGAVDSTTELDPVKLVGHGGQVLWWGLTDGAHRVKHAV